MASRCSRCSSSTRSPSTATTAGQTPSASTPASSPRSTSSQVDELLGELAADEAAAGYRSYLAAIPVESTHQGYFSIDRKTGRSIDGDVKRTGDEKGQSTDADAYDLILRDKERLLSLEEQVRFIFSHSALREGWDNPNVFVMGMLKKSDNTVSRRQEIGRGLRLAVNQHGERTDDPGDGALDQRADGRHRRVVHGLRRGPATGTRRFAGPPVLPRPADGRKPKRGRPSRESPGRASRLPRSVRLRRPGPHVRQRARRPPQGRSAAVRRAAGRVCAADRAGSTSTLTSTHVPTVQIPSQVRYDLLGEISAKTQTHPPDGRVNPAPDQPGHVRSVPQEPAQFITESARLIDEQIQRVMVVAAGR